MLWGFWFMKKMCYLKISASRGWLKPKKSGKNPLICKTFGQILHKIRVFARLLVKICVSKVFLDLIQKCVFARSAYLEATYLEALL